MTTRYAVYYAPEQDDPLWRAGCDWLGRDPAGGAVGPPPCLPHSNPPGPGLPGIEALTADARGYGFHATLKPPMRLREGVTRQDLLEAMAEVAAGVPSFALPALAVADFGGFLCLRERRESAALQAMCDATVAGLDHLRAAPGEAELAKRRGAGLAPFREANLRRWGYPDVFAGWFFHMTLTHRLRPEHTAVAQPVAATWFARALSTDRFVHDMCLFEQDGSEPFRLTARVRLPDGEVT